jgi:formylglycine-generating enzyme required for sulfatase activity
MPIEPEIVIIPAGEFVMGSPEGEAGRNADGREGPQHPVSFSKPFGMAKGTVTVAAFAQFVDATNRDVPGEMLTWENDVLELRRPRDFRSPGFPQTEHCPVVGVTWFDARDYASWLAQVTGKAYRLLSEAEWEYGTRAGSRSAFWWGDTITSERANYDGSWLYGGQGEPGEYRGRTLPVHSLEPNPWGIYQCHGNIWEWCADLWHATYDDAPSDGSPWLEPATDERRVVRGGSWYGEPKFLRSAARNRYAPDYRENRFGFRLGLSL